MNKAVCTIAALLAAKTTLRQLPFLICCLTMLHATVHPAYSQGPTADLPPKHTKQFTVRTVIFTGIILEQGEYVHIVASGQIYLGGVAGYAGPDGKFFFPMYNYDKDALHGALLAVVNKYVHEVGSGAAFVSPANDELVLLINDNAPANNRGEFAVSVNVYEAKPYKQRLAELNTIRKNGDLDALVQWLTENPDWTDGLPKLPPTLEEARRSPDLWHISSKNFLSPHEGEWEIRQLRDVTGQKFPGVGVQGLYDAKGNLIPNEGTPDVASPRDTSSTTQHLVTDYKLYNRFLQNYGPLNGEIKYRELYNVQLPDRFKTPRMLEAQQKWEEDRVGPEP